MIPAISRIRFLINVLFLFFSKVEIIKFDNKISNLKFFKKIPSLEFNFQIFQLFSLLSFAPLSQKKESNKIEKNSFLCHHHRFFLLKAKFISIHLSLTLFLIIRLMCIQFLHVFKFFLRLSYSSLSI